MEQSEQLKLLENIGKALDIGSDLNARMNGEKTPIGSAIGNYFLLAADSYKKLQGSLSPKEAAHPPPEN